MTVPSVVSRALLVGLVLTGCTSWQPGTVAPAQLLGEKHPESVRVIRTDDSRVRMYWPHIVGDSLRGTGVTNAQQLSVALADVREIDLPKISAGRTIGVVLLTGVLVAGLVIVVYVIPAVTAD